MTPQYYNFITKQKKLFSYAHKPQTILIIHQLKSAVSCFLFATAKKATIYAYGQFIANVVLFLH